MINAVRQAERMREKESTVAEPLTVKRRETAGPGGQGGSAGAVRLAWAWRGLGPGASACLSCRVLRNAA